MPVGIRGHPILTLVTQNLPKELPRCTICIYSFSYQLRLSTRSQDRHYPLSLRCVLESELSHVKSGLSVAWNDVRSPTSQLFICPEMFQRAFFHTSIISNTWLWIALEINPFSLICFRNSIIKPNVKEHVAMPLKRGKKRKMEAGLLKSYLRVVKMLL